MCDPAGATGLRHVRIWVGTVVLTHDLWERDAVLFRLAVVSCGLACLMKGGCKIQWDDVHLEGPVHSMALCRLWP